MAEHQKWMKSSDSFRKLASQWLVVGFMVFCTLAEASIAQTLEYRYEPPCRMQDFTWTSHDGQTHESNYVDFPDGCTNPLPPLVDEAMGPPPVSNLRTVYYTTEFVSAVDYWRQWEGTWSCVNITFHIGPEAAGKITGILFSRRSLNIDSDDYGEYSCRAYDFGGPLDAEALLGEDGNPLEMYFDCFRGQKPGMAYEYTIRTLPVVAIDGEVTNENAVTLQYRTPSCYAIPDDFLCIDKTEGPLQDNELCAHWRPQYLILTAEYLELSIAIEIGPEECGFNKFRVSAPTEAEYSNGLWNKGFIDVDVANSSHYETFDYGRDISFIEMSLATGPGQRVVTITPQPTHNTCFTREGQDRLCSVTLSAVLKVTENPCLSGPTHCSDAVHVCKPVGDQATCVCKPGYMTVGDSNDHCIVNPCAPLGSSYQTPYNPCGIGKCISNDDNNSYSCNCSYGYAFIDGTCQVDPCHQDPDSESNLCGNHGECKHVTNVDSVSVKYVCTCDSGFEYNASQHICQVSMKVLVAVIIMSLLVAALLIMVLILWRQHKDPRSLVYQALKTCKKGEGDEGIIHDMSSISLTSSRDNIPVGTPTNQRERIEIIRPLKRVKTALFYTNDNSLHEDTVQKLAKFLEVECMCDVKTPLSCEKDIALKGKSEWTSYILQWADKVIFLCSKGTHVKWHSLCRNAGMKETPDMFMLAVAFSLQDHTSLSLPDKYCVSYFDYSQRSNIPEPLSVGAVFCLMKHMDALFFRLHNMTPGSPSSQKRAPNLEEEKYATMSLQGKALHSALKCAHDFEREAADWDEKLQNDMLQPGSLKLPSIPNHLLDTTSQVDDDDFDQSLRKLEARESSFI